MIAGIPMNNVIELRPGFEINPPKKRNAAGRRRDEKQIADLKTRVSELEKNLENAPDESTHATMQDAIEYAEKRLSEMKENMIYRRRVYTQDEWREAIEELLSEFSRIY